MRTCYMKRRHPQPEGKRDSFINGVVTSGDPYGKSKIRSPANTTHTTPGGFQAYM